MRDFCYGRVLVLGATGMAGHVMYEYLQRPEFEYSVLGTARFSAPGLLEFDAMWAPEDIERFFKEQGPLDAVINCIGCLVHDSQEDPGLALRLNATLPRHLELIFKDTETKVVHISTDCVFDGLKGESYSIDDAPTESSNYGLTKRLGEINNDKDWTIRTSIIGPELSTKPSAPNNSGLLHWFLTQDPDADLKGYTHAFWSGISTIELAQIVAHNLFEGYCGIQQVSRNSKISKFELLQTAKNVFHRNWTIEPCDVKKVDKSLIPCVQFPMLMDHYHVMLDELRDWIKERPHLYRYDCGKSPIMKVNFYLDTEA